jgi:hypothetical protein
MSIEDKLRRMDAALRECGGAYGREPLDTIRRDLALKFDRSGHGGWLGFYDFLFSPTATTRILFVNEGNSLEVRADVCSASECFGTKEARLSIDAHTRALKFAEAVEAIFATEVAK